MIIILKNNAQTEKIDELLSHLNKLNLKTQLIRDETKSLIVLMGDTTRLDKRRFLLFDAVHDVKPISPPFIKSNKNNAEKTIVEVSNKKIGDGHFSLIAGPCSVESEKQIVEIAKKVKESGADFLRGGAFKPRTSPYLFQGLGKKGLQYLIKAKKEVGMPIVSEIVDIKHIDAYADVDILQVGARNMQNYELLKELGRSKKPVLLKRAVASTIEQWLMSAEYLQAWGNKNIILCERGTQTNLSGGKNSLDIMAIPLVKKTTHLPLIVDPSHASGSRFLVKPLSKSATAAGADGLMIEVHNNPKEALSDGAQSLYPEEFDVLCQQIKKIKFAIE